MKVLVVFYSTYGHVYKMAEAIVESAEEVGAAEVELRRVPENPATGRARKDGRS